MIKQISSSCQAGHYDNGKEIIACHPDYFDFYIFEVESLEDVIKCVVSYHLFDYNQMFLGEGNDIILFKEENGIISEILAIFLVDELFPR